MLPRGLPAILVDRFIRRWAAVYHPGRQVRLIGREDRFGRGGPHTAFHRRGDPGVRLSESRENYSRPHASADTLAGVDFGYLARNTRVHSATVATLPLGPAAPDVGAPGGSRLARGSSGYDAESAWEPVPNISVDDDIFGVAAIGPEGHESLVACVRPPRSFHPIREIGR